MDAFGNPLGLASDLKESFEGLLFEGDLGGFVSGLGYGVTNSISKVIFLLFFPNQIYPNIMYKECKETIQYIVTCTMQAGIVKGLTK